MNHFRPVSASGFSLSSAFWRGAVDHVADAFRRRGHLVELHFSNATHPRYVVAVDSAEAYSAEDALTIAAERGARSVHQIGNLIASRVLVDNDANRRLLGVFGEEDQRPHRTAGWRNAA